MGSSVTPIVVLVVEDEVIQRWLATEIVEGAGLIAVEATNAEEAIEILEQRADIRIVFTDVDMPGSMDGVRLAQAVRERWPPIGLIVTSGTRVPVEDIPCGTIFFAKPYRPDAVREAMRRLAA